MSKIIQGKFKIVSNKKAGCDYYKMTISAREVVKAASPGQFVHLRCIEGNQPLLRRPFSFHRLNSDNFEILYEVVGQGTRLLTKRKKGEKIDVLGPLGNGFDVKGANIILVAGGMGVAPLFALAEHIVHSSQFIVHSKKKKLYVLIGARKKNHILCERDFRRLGTEVLVSTEDGSKGRRGLITDSLKSLLSTIDYRLSTIYACGPKEMLKELSNISARFNISAYGSLEENMACGVGACLGCAVETKRGYERICKEGPVFNLKDIKW
ncbi:MAG: dihydroorotate dehydrogenase electron transfer subunit [Candidatus Omnitrophota bacterium]|nr:MAG: dihydroorotate dehydrogenase electron transfer subunit [Candidatus Omnitrophota bacterium]